MVTRKQNIEREGGVSAHVTRNRIRGRRNRVTAVLACMVAVATAMALMLPALSMTRGATICGLEEHTHTESCYEHVLACGQEETRGHVHAADCYDEDGTLTCELEETQGHTHTDSCYEDRLTCDLEEHIHSDDCYAQEEEEATEPEGAEIDDVDGAVEDADADDEASDATDDADTSDAAASDGSHPAQSFEQKVDDRDDFKVSVEAPEGALPANSTMKVEPVAAEDVQEAVEQAMSLEDNEYVASIQSVDIAFKNAEGDDIEPAEPITVTLISDFIAENEDLSVVHIADDGVSEVVDTLTDEQLADRDMQPADDELAFESSEFSTYSIVVTKGSTQIAAAKGETVSITASVKDSYQTSFKWNSDDENVVTVTGDTATATLTANNAGTATVTLTYKYGKNKNNANSSDSVQYTVTVTKQSKISESDATATTDQGTSNPKVTVKDTGRAKALNGYHVVVRASEGTYGDDDVLAAYRIYLADEYNNEVSADDLKVNGNVLNLQVTLTYETAPAWMAQAQDVKHYQVTNGEKKKAGISGVSIDADHNTISFTVNHFSDFVVSSSNPSGSSTSGGTSAVSQQGSILDGRTFNNANEWQIVSGKYEGNAAGNKANYGNDAYKAARVQKNVIPTSVENEFYVYLSVDTKELLREWLTYATYNKASQNNWHGHSIGDIVSEMESEKSVFTADPSMVGQTGPKGTIAWYTNVDVVDDKGNVILENLPIYSDQSQNNATVFLKIDDSHYVLFGVSVQKSKTNSGRSQCKLGAEAMQLVQQEVLKMISLDKVTDTMGGNIEFLEVVSGSYTTEPTCSDGVLTWYPTMKTNPPVYQTGSGGSIQRWYMNTAELLYKVRLNVAADGFNSCAGNMNSKTTDEESYPVNKSATIDYTISVNGTNNTGSATFPVPYVRGLLYDVRVKKVDQEGTPLNKVSFAFAGSGNNGTVKYSFTGASGSDGYVTWKDVDTTVSNPGVAWGSYTITETVPTGYAPDPAYTSTKGKDGTYTTSIPATLCYTTNSGDLVANGTHMALKENGNDYLTVTNRRNKITITKAVDWYGTDGSKSDVDHVVRIALWHGGDNGDYLRDANGEIIYKEITITNDKPDPLSVTFGDDELIPTDEYSISELAQVNGEWAYNWLNEGFDSHGKRIQGYSIDFTPDNKVNFAKKSFDQSSDGAKTVTNTYSTERMVKFSVTKKWVKRSTGEAGVIEVTPPSGTNITIELYRKEKSAADSAYAKYENKKVVLDGTPDGNGETAAWVATFKDLPKFNSDETVEYVYAVKESGSPADFEVYSDPNNSATMGEDDYITTSGNNIWNIQKTTSIVVKKEDDSNHFLAGAKFKLYRMDVDPNDASKTIDTLVGDEFAVSDENGATISGLVSGDYKLVESVAPNGYVMLADSIEFKVNATGSDYVVSWKGSQPDKAKALSGTNNDTITVINTPGKALPNTGGAGTLPYTLGGSLLIAAALMYGIRARRRGRRLKRGL